MKPLDIQCLRQANVLIRVPNWIGDAVMCLPALRELRNALPEASIALLGRPWVLDVFPSRELRCELIPYDTKRVHAGLRGRLRIASELRKRNFAAAILFQNAFDAALVAWLARIPVRCGYARDARRLLLTHAVDVPAKGSTPDHESYYYLEMLRRLGPLSELPNVDSEARLLEPPEREQARRELLSILPNVGPSTGRVVAGFGAGASFGTAKRWPAERFAALSRRLQEELGAACVFFGAPDERAAIESIVSSAGERAHSLAGKTSLNDFMRLAPACDLFITNDTGTMHVAAALGVPTIAIFGPTDECGTRPLGPNVSLIVGEADCRPCKLRHCPIDHRCMTSVDVDTVFERARSVLSSGKRGATASALFSPD